MMYLQFLIPLLFPLLGESIELAQSVKSREASVWMQLEAASHGKNFSFNHNINRSIYLNSSEHGSTKLPFCTRNTSTCIDLRGFNLTCLGTELPYSATTFDLTSDYIPTDLIKVQLDLNVISPSFVCDGFLFKKFEISNIMQMIMEYFLF